MRTSMATRSLILIIGTIIAGGLLAPCSDAAVTIEIGDYRELALQFVKEKWNLSEDAARSVMRHYEVMHGDRIINTLELPDGAVLDFVTVDGEASDPDSLVTFEGSGVLHSARPELFGAALSEGLRTGTPQERARLIASIREAMNRGWFVQQITSEQRENLLDYKLPGDEGQMRPQAARIVRILVVLNNFPHWNDISPAPGRYDTGGDREHPISDGWIHTPGGPLATSAPFQPSGLTSPAWSHTGEAPIGSGGSTANHPRIEYRVEGRKGTSVDLRERWYDFLFNLSNDTSVTNYYWANSNGNLRIQGDRSDVRGPLESRHILDRVAYGGAEYDYAIQPGTPILRPVPEPTNPPYGVPNLRAATADSGRNTIATLGYNSGVSIGGLQWFNASANRPAWTDLAINNVYVDQYDSRRRVYAVASFNTNVPLRFNVPGGQVNITADAGWSADSDQGPDGTLFSRNEVLDSAAGNRLLSMCYYTHDHATRDGAMGSRPYQLAHLRNSRGRIDDVGGTVDSSQDHADRPKPYDHDIIDHGQPNFGYFESPDSNGGHTYGVWLGHLRNIMVENGISTAGYNSVINLYPSDAAAGPDQGGTSGPWSGLHVFIPNSAVVLPSDAGLVVTAHELGHALMGWPDLYDLDFYTNSYGHEPPLDVTNMIGPYSLMARAGGVRVDAFLKTLAGWATPVALTEDILRAQVPQVEGTLQDPVIYKLPGRPHYIPTGVPPNQWQEFFLVENRNRNGAEYFGDPSPKGLYIYHVDLRFSQTSEDHPMVIVEQADGLFELERNPEGQYGDLEGDPFPGALGVRNWTQYTNPGSQSHGWKEGTSSPNQIGPMVVEPPTPPAGTLLNGTQTDSFSRVTNISDPGALMFADLHVVPREVIVTAVPIPDQPSQISQGTTDLLVQHLNFNNSGTLPNFSMGDVEIATLRIDETGSSQRDTDIDRVSLFDDTDANGEFDPAVDTRIATTSIQSQSAFFTNLNYRIPLDEQRDLFVTYDISTGANPAQGNSVGAGIARHDYVLPKVPGAVQERARSAITATSPGLGAHRFPIVSSFVGIVEDPDTLTITPISRAPLEPVPAAEGLRVLAIEPGDVDVPILSLNLEVDQDSVTIDQVTVDETGTINAVAHITAARLYIDNNQDGAVDGGDTLLEETTFANVAGTQRAIFDIATNPVQVNEGAMRSLLLTASISPDLPLEEPPLTLQYSLANTSYIRLRQHSDDPQYHDIVSDENFPMASDIVSTPVPNEPPAPPQNLAATVLTDGSVLLEWDLSPDDPDVGGEADVVHYNIYRSTDPADFATVTPAEVYATVGAGGTQYNDLNAPLATDLYYMARAWDGVQEGPNSNVAGPVRASDEVAPTFSAFDPAEGAENVPLDSNIAFTITDTASGIDRDSLVFEVDGVDVAAAAETTITGSNQQLRVEYDPPEDFDYLQSVDVRLQVADNEGNVAPGAGQFHSYSFTAIGPPTFFIAGIVSDADGNPEPDVRVEAGGLFAMTDAQGQYQITGLAAGNYTVVPSKDDRSFQPEERAVTLGPSAVAIDFTVYQGFDISGSVLTDDGDPLAGVRVSDGLHSVVTGPDGLWEISDVPAGTYTVTPTLDGWVFTPSDITVTVNATQGGSAGNEFVAALQTFGITGTIRSLTGARLAGIQVEALQNDTLVATATTNANGVYGLTGLAPGTYTVRAVSTAYAFDPEERVIDIATDTANVDFVGAMLYSMTVPAGLSFVGVPVEPLDDDPAAVFGADADIARWDPQLADYLMAPSASPIMQVAPGRGFWVRTDGALDLDTPGQIFGNDQSLTLNAERTWNMFANPYDRDLPWEQLNIPAGSPASTYGFIYDTEANTYRLVSTTIGLGARTIVPRHNGFWLRSGAATQVVINAPGAAPASAEVAAAAARKPAADAWIIPMVARAAGSLDACSYAGVLPGAASNPASYQMDNPPAIAPYVDLYFIGDGGRALAVDVRENAPMQTWQFAVTTDIPGARVELQLPDLSEVPTDKAVYLIDEAAGKRLYARTLTTYSYDSADGGPRRFRLEVSDRGEGALMITSASAQTAGGGGIAVSYSLSADANVRVEVLNIAGRTVATVATGDASPAGLSTVSWNGRSSNGTLCPSGRYLVRVSAVAEDGQRVQALVPVQLQR